MKRLQHKMNKIRYNEIVLGFKSFLHLDICIVWEWGWAYLFHGMHPEIRGQLTGIGSVSVSSLLLASRDWSQTVRFGRKHLYPLICHSDFRIKPGAGHSPFLSQTKLTSIAATHFQSWNTHMARYHLWASLPPQINYSLGITHAKISSARGGHVI